MIVFFGVVHPIPINSPDDWNYVSDNRIAIPIWGSWNPAKVLPEVLAPICGSISAFVVTPLIGDYVLSFSVTICVLLSFFISIYCVLFYKICRSKFSCSIGQSFFLTLFFLLLHFALFRSGDSNNPYLFYAWDMNCYYNYVIPNLLNTILVMYCVEHDVFTINTCNKSFSIKESVFVLCCYLALASNLFGSIIFASYLLLVIIAKTSNQIKAVKKITKDFIINNRRILYLIVFWIAVQFFEMNGARSKDLGDAYQGLSFYHQLSLSITYWLNSVSSINRWVGYFSFLVALVSLWLFLRQRKNSQYYNIVRTIITFTAIALMSLVYCLLVCSKASPTYIRRPEVLASWNYSFIIMIVLMLAAIYKQYKYYSNFLPILILFFYTEANSDYNTYKDVAADSFVEKYESSLAACRCIQDIDRHNVKEAILYVPESITSAESYWNYLTRTLYKHGQSRNHIKINMIIIDNCETIHWKPVD